MQKSPKVVPILNEHGPIETEAMLHERDGLRSRLPAGNQVRDVVRRDEEHDKDDRRHHPEHQEPECNSADEELRHR